MTAARFVPLDRVVHLGKHEPKLDERTLQLASYVPPDLTKLQIPARVKRSNKVASWPMYGNDSLPDCTCAAVGHIEQLLSAAAGAPETPSDADVLEMFDATGSRDDGRFCLDILNRWHSIGFGADREKIFAFAAIDLHNIRHVEIAIDLFGAVYAGIALPISAQGQDVWSVSHASTGRPGSWGGHCVPLVDYDSSGFSCITWGRVQRMTPGFWKHYADEAYAVLSPDWARSRHPAPGGFKLADLRRDLEALRG